MAKKKDTNSQNEHRETSLTVETNFQGEIIDNPIDFHQRTYNFNQQRDATPYTGEMRMGVPSAQQTREQVRTKAKPTKQVKKGTMSTKDPKLEEAIKKDNESKGIYNNGKQQGN
jgi:hypothetical protein